MSDRLPGIRPRPSLWHRLDGAARHGFPATLTAILLLLSAAPLGLPGQAALQMAVVLGAVFFWSLYRPDCMTPVSVFLLGVLADLLGYAPPGVGVLILLLAHGVALRWRRFLVKQGFMLVWLAYWLVACVAAALQWALTSLLMFRLLPPGAALFQAILAAGLYPVLSLLLVLAHQALTEGDPA